MQMRTKTAAAMFPEADAGDADTSRCRHADARAKTWRPLQSQRDLAGEASTDLDLRRSRDVRSLGPQGTVSSGLVAEGGRQSAVGAEMRVLGR